MNHPITHLLKKYLQAHATHTHVRVMWLVLVLVVGMGAGLGASLKAWSAPLNITANGIGSTKETQEPSAPPDTFGRTSPRGTVHGFIAAIANDDKELAAQFLDSNFLRSTKTPKEKVVTDFKAALDIGGRLQGDLYLSDNPEGNLTDNLPNNSEKIGSIDIDGNSIDILLVRKTDRHGTQYWQFDQQTLENLPTIKNSNPSLAQKIRPSWLKDKVLAGFNLGDIFALLVILVISISVVYVLVWLIFGLMRWLYPRLRGKRFGITPKMILPLTVLIVSLLLSSIMLEFGVPVTLRAKIEPFKEIVAWIATAWLAIRFIDTLFNRVEASSVRRNRPEQVSLLSLLRKVAKVFMLILAVILIFGNLGFDLTTGIAALGVGGLALAFGAQKTIENLIGSVVVVADRPIRVGDYGRFGDFEGTVIDIGIRSSRIRTLNRTVVTVPNGAFSNMQIENYATRDMFHFLHELYVKRDVDPQELGRMIRGIQMFISEHSYVNNEWTQVRISQMRQDSFVIEMRCYIDARDVREFYTKQSELIVDILSQLEQYAVEFALPSQSLQIDKLSDANK